jgi:very-short-patch-repair endonuclease
VEGEGGRARTVKRNNVDRSRHLRKNQTDAETKLWQVIRNRGLSGAKFRRQFPLDKYILDFYSPELKLCIEADGGQHYTNEGEQNDGIRTKTLRNLGIQVLRFSDRDILLNIEGVCEVIQKTIENNPPHLSPLPNGERRITR